MILLAVLALQPTAAAKLDLLRNEKPVARNAVRVDGPAVVDETVGTITVYTLHKTWDEVAPHVRAQLQRQFGQVDEIRGGWGALIPLGGADWRFYWGNGAGLGLYRGFKANAQKVADPYGASFKLKGVKAPGWTTVVVFDGEVRTKHGF